MVTARPDFGTLTDNELATRLERVIAVAGMDDYPVDQDVLREAAERLRKR